MTITKEQLIAIMPLAAKRADRFIDALNATMDEFEINTPARQASFLSQIGHESGQLRYVEELASGSAYEGRKDLGNLQIGDGVRFKGRGLIQITGRVNYAALMLALDIDCIEHPELLEEPINACRSAGWFWQSHNINELADAGDQVRITKRINGGINGLADRIALFQIAKKVLGE
jgi:putative chitinase